MSEQHDWLEAYQSVGAFVREGNLNRGLGQLFCLDHHHNDGTLVLLGKDIGPCICCCPRKDPLRMKT